MGTISAAGALGVTFPGDVQKTCRCGISGHGSTAMVVLGQQLDLEAAGS